MKTCERTDPLTRGRCGYQARVDVMYQIQTEAEPRGIRICAVHWAELQQAPYILILNVRIMD